MSARRLLNVGYTMAVEVAGRNAVEKALAEAAMPPEAKRARDSEAALADLRLIGEVG